ncbi:MAG: helix-turn-helix domain-containing protein [Clostridiales bacterium]|jgi:putative transposase|nr:helix-turn-helix domain-containing protein [Clostridiales bacterium]
MYKAFQLRAYPNKEQAILFAEAFGCVRKVYDLMLEDKIKLCQETKEMLHAAPAMYKEQYPYLKEAGSLALASAQLNLEAAYKNFLENPDAGFPNFKCKHRGENSYAANCASNNIRIEDQYIMPPEAGRVRIKKHRAAPDNCKLQEPYTERPPH